MMYFREQNVISQNCKRIRAFNSEVKLQVYNLTSDTASGAFDVKYNPIAAY